MTSSALSTSATVLLCQRGQRRLYSLVWPRRMQKWQKRCRSCKPSALTVSSLGRRSLVVTANESYPTTIARLLQVPQNYEGQNVQVKGFVQTVRKQSKVVFAAIRDGSTAKTLQAVLTPEHGQTLSVGQAVSLDGTWSPCRARQQTHEMQVKSARLQGENSPDDNPLQNKYQSEQFLRTIPHLRPRMPSFATLLRLRSQMITQANVWFSEHDFVQTHTPVITSSDCEGAGEVFNVATSDSKDPHEHFRGPKYLSVSAQLHLEALCQAVDRVWTLSPSFRAEQSDTARHLSEFYMLEAEMAHTEKLGEVMDVVEGLIRHMAQAIVGNVPLSDDLIARQTPAYKTNDDADGVALGADALRSRWQGLSRKHWPRITYGDAMKALCDTAEADASKFEHKPSQATGLHAEHERWLATNVGQGSPIFITHYPRSQKPFYMLPSTGSESNTVDCFDLIAPDVCELAGGSLREYRSRELHEAMVEKGVMQPADQGDMPANVLDWYMDLRRYGSVPHGGFGIGFDRLLCYLAGVSNVRDMVVFPRYYGRCDA